MTEYAFPHSPGQHPGMTLRDWFAGQALANTVFVDKEGSPEENARYAYILAEELMETRKNYTNS
tara:strand:- start:26254 stop:26445 length:192 start_codon:yes stop_codon:yes gene_type:complete